MICPTCEEDAGLGFCWTCNKDLREPKAKTAMATESLSEEQIQSQVKDYLAVVGCDVVDTSQPRATMITEGVADLAVFADGAFAWAEIKRPGGKQRESQKRFESWCARAGVSYFIWTSVDDARKWFERAQEAA